MHKIKDETLAIHYGYDAFEAHGTVAVPIFQTNAFEFENSDHATKLFDLERSGHIYSRLSNPTVNILESRITSLEQGCSTLCLSSGSAAVACTLLNILTSGSNIIAFEQMYGATYTFLKHILPQYGIETRFADFNNKKEIQSLVDDKTHAIFTESITNPSGRIADLEMLAEVATEASIPLIVDNTVASPALLKPANYGAAIVIHSLGKFIGGNGAAMGGSITDTGIFDWKAAHNKFPMLSEPEPAYHDICYNEKFGKDAFIARCRTVGLRNTGAALSPFNAFLIIQGLHTLHLRVDKHSENSKSLIHYLDQHEKIITIDSAGLASHIDHAHCTKYLNGKFPSLFSFTQRGGHHAVIETYDSFELCKRMINLGDIRTNACHPASTTHRQLSETELFDSGITQEMMRVCVGIEHIDDIISDFGQALRNKTNLEQ